MRALAALCAVPRWLGQTIKAYAEQERACAMLSALGIPDARDEWDRFRRLPEIEEAINSSIHSPAKFFWCWYEIEGYRASKGIGRDDPFFTYRAFLAAADLMQDWQRGFYLHNSDPIRAARAVTWDREEG